VAGNSFQREGYSRLLHRVPNVATRDASDLSAERGRTSSAERAHSRGRCIAARKRRRFSLLRPALHRPWAATIGFVPTFAKCVGYWSAAVGRGQERLGIAAGGRWFWASDQPFWKWRGAGSIPVTSTTKDLLRGGVVAPQDTSRTQEVSGQRISDTLKSVSNGTTATESDRTGPSQSQCPPAPRGCFAQADPVGAEYLSDRCHATSRYSWMSPPRSSS
jgi:hypothetical protein